MEGGRGGSQARYLKGKVLREKYFVHDLQIISELSLLIGDGQLSVLFLSLELQKLGDRTMGSV